MKMDSYDLQARHAPVAFALLPLVLVAIVLIPGLGQAKLAATSVGSILVAAAPFVAIRLVRSAGHARQSALFQSWGGIPTTAMLRYRDTRLNPYTKALYRERLARLGASFVIPSEEDEQRHPADADLKIGAAMDEIRRRAKERGVKAVHRENVNYGAARNIYGLRPFGIVACAIAAGVLAANIALRGAFTPTPAELAVAMAILVITGIWLFACTAHSVRRHAEAYALALFEAIETVTVQPKRKKP
jgi:hypothetical protein